MSTIIYSGFVHHGPKQIPGLFQDFQGPFSQFSRTKNHESTADFQIQIQIQIILFDSIIIQSQEGPLKTETVAKTVTTPSVSYET